MHDEPNAIDVSSLTELVRIKHEADVLRERLEKMATAEKRVSEIVFRRVRADYESRKAALEAEAAAPRKRAGVEYAKLRAQRGDAEKGLEEAKFRNEELEFRHDLGEFADDDYRSRLGECQAQLAERQKELDRLTGLRDEFLKAFPSEEDLERAASASGPAPSPKRSAETASMPIPPPSAPDSTAKRAAPGPLPPPSAPDSTAKRPAPGPLPPAADVPSATVAMRLARLVLLVDDEPYREYILKPEPMSIGRSPENFVHIPFPDVSRQHASIVPEGTHGFKLIDRGSPNGLIVNGEVVKEHVLSDGDIIQVGRRKLVFRG